MGKYKMPNATEFFTMKDKSPKPEPVWVYLEREMNQNVPQKPYNQKVGDWLTFLKEMKLNQKLQAKKKYNKLKYEVGPPWFCELPTFQRNILNNLKTNIHQDLLEDLPRRTRKALSDLGITIKFSNKGLLRAMKNCCTDPGVFLWNLYTDIYKISPAEFRKNYDINSKLIMSSLAFIDLEETIASLERITEAKTKAPEPPISKPSKKQKQGVPPVPFGSLYLQNTAILPHSIPEPKKKEKSKIEFDYKINLRSKESLEKLRKDETFLSKRIEQNKKMHAINRVTTYKFWEAPSTLRNKDPKMVDYALKLRMLKKVAKIHAKSPYNNQQYRIEGVAFSNGAPHFIVNNSSVLPTGYVVINAGMVFKRGVGLIMHLAGNWRCPTPYDDFCDKTCDCLKHWEAPVMDYLKKTKCTCGHLYDYGNQGRLNEKYFYPPTRHGPLWFDKAKIFQMDPMEDFIKETVKTAVKSREPTPPPPRPRINASELRESQLVATLLADLSGTPLIIPHLPEANRMNRLKEWARNRVKGAVTAKQRKKIHLQQLRAWNDLSRIKFTVAAPRIHFAAEHLNNMNWNHRGILEKLSTKVKQDFVLKNKLRQIEQSRMWWPTMKHDMFHTKSFLDTFYTYMPTTTKGIYLINPYDRNKVKVRISSGC